MIIKKVNPMFKKNDYKFCTNKYFQLARAPFQPNNQNVLFKSKLNEFLFQGVFF